jgi:hypothetical protein
MSTPFAYRPGAQASYAALRGARDREPAEVIDPAAHSRLDRLEDRVDALESKDGRDGEDEEGGSDGE